MRPIFGVLNHYRPEVDNEKEIDIGHGRGMAKGRADGRLMLKNFLDSLEESMDWKKLQTSKILSSMQVI